MNDQMTAFAAAWRRVWAAPDGTMVAPLRLDDTPAYPLARTVQMPPGHGYETGALSFRMTGLTLDGLRRLDAERSLLTQDETGLRVQLAFAQLVLRGRYAMEVKPDPIIELDTAGNLMDLPPEARTPTAAGADADDNGTDPQTEAWLDQARDQRTTLSQTTNGQALLSLYDTHNELYDIVFRTNPALTPLWQNGGATKAMAADTSDAVTNDTVVNDSTKTYDTGNGSITYNGNAFVQQLNVASACVWTDPDFNAQTGPPPDSPYWAAAKAALSFGKGVTTTTNNTQDNVNEMKPSEVHGTVQSYQGTLPEVTDDEMAQVVALGVGAGGEEAVDLGWIVIREEDRQRLRYLYQATMKYRAENAAIVGQPLFAGICEARIAGVEGRCELALEDAPGGQRARARAVRVELPAFELDIDDAGWTGAAGAVARQRLERMYFIRSLLLDALSARLHQALGEAAVAAYNALLQES